MHQDTLKILRDMIDFLNELKVDRYLQKRLSGVEQEDYRKLIRVIDAANRHVVVLQRALEDEKKTVF